MNRSPSFITKRMAAAGLLLAAVLGAGCGEEPPPYDTLPLRDALRAAPEVIAALPEETRRDVALRIEEAEHEDENRTAIPPQEVSTLDALIGAADEAREDEGKDALVLGEIEAAESGLLLHARPAPETKNEATNEEPPAVRGKAGAATAKLEEAALEGRAGRTLRDLAKRTHARDIVRTTGLPVGAVAWNETLYVNASWLVALSALEKDRMDLPPPSPGGASASDAPPKKPLSVDYNPYMLPDSVAECANQVLDTCSCATSSSCLHSTTDPTFDDANAECKWVNQGPSNAIALCVLALLNIDGVRACVESGGSVCSALPVTTRAEALVFAASASCMGLLDACLSGQDVNEPPPSSGSQGCSGCGNSSCDGCNDDCSQCNDNCSKCNDNCSECNENCAECNQNYQDCKSCSNCKSGEASAAYASAGQCNMKPRPGRSPLPSPLGTALCLFAPAAYLLSLSRKRRRP
jgi:hypothetical protein